MNIKKVICSICGKEVSKRKTYSVGNGERACREHDGVEDTKNSFKEQEMSKRLNIKAEQEKKARRERERLDEPSKPMCWRCGEKGIFSQAFFVKKLVAMEKHDIAHAKPTNPFVEGHPFTDRPKEPVIFVVAIEKLPKDIHIIPEMREFVTDRMIPVVPLCINCIKMCGIENPMPKMSMEDLEKMAPITEAVMPFVRETAMRELGRDQ